MWEYLGSHVGEVSSVLSIIVTVILSARWMWNSFHKDIQEIRNDTKEFHHRIDVRMASIDARIDKSYEMYCDMQREIKELYLKNAR